MKWVEIERLKVGDEVLIRRQGLEVVSVTVAGERVTLQGTTEDGRAVTYVGSVGESIQRIILQEA